MPPSITISDGRWAEPALKGWRVAVTQRLTVGDVEAALTEGGRQNDKQGSGMEDDRMKDDVG